MAMYSAQTDESALALLGKRMAAFRVRNNWTQAKLAQMAGVSKGTVERIERGDSVQILNLVKVLRACDMLDTFLGIFPDDSPSPMQILQMGKIKPRQRAGSPHKKKSSQNIISDTIANYSATPNSSKKKPWVWEEDK
jgi:transcriptional regulator with XRE-family HTH domain